MNRRAVISALTAFSLLAGVTPLAQAQDRLAYRVILGAGSNETSNTVSWRSVSAGEQSLKYYPTDRTDKAVTVTAQERDFSALLYRSYEAVMTDLQPNTTYTYRVGSDASGWSQEFNFTTSDFDSNWNFLAFADPQIGVNLKNAEQGDNWRRAVSKGLADAPDTELILSLGDQVDGWGAIEPQYDEFFSPDALRSIPVAAIAGNHETYMAGIKHFQEHYSLPNELGSTSNYYYERNNALFISLNSNRSTPADLAEHESFLRDTVAKHGANNDWIILSYHHGPFSQGSHVTDADVVALRDALTPVISELGIDLVLSGHDHIYTRSHLMNGTTPVVPAQRAERGDVLTPGENEVLYITTTTAGGGKYYDFTDRNGATHPGTRRELMDPNLEQPWTSYWRQDYTPDYLNVQVSPEELTLTTYNVDTPYVVDKVTLKNNKAPVVAPPTTAQTSTPTSQSSAPSATNTPVVTTTPKPVVATTPFIPWWEKFLNFFGVRY